MDIKVNYFDRFMEILDALEANNVTYALVGGYAVVLYGHPRLTQDIDLFLKPDQENIRNLQKTLKSIFNDESIDEITLDSLIQYPVIRYGSPDGFYIDLIIKIGDAFTFDDIEIVTMDIEGHTIHVASPHTLYKMKCDTVRPVDKSDSFFLKRLIDGKRDGSV